MTFERFESASELFAEVALRLRSRLADKSGARVLLPAGNTPVGLYREAARLAREHSFATNGAHFFQLDEVVGIPEEHPASFRAQIHGEFLAPLAVPESQQHLLHSDSTRASETIAEHADALTRLGGSSLAILGLGLNGHVAFNEPGTSVSTGARVVELASESQAALASRFSPESEPKSGITLGLREIHSSDEVWLLVTGRSKASILHRVVSGTADEGVPASLLLEHPQLTIFGDADAWCELDENLANA